MSVASDILCRLNERRVSLGMSCRVLARRCGLSVRTVQRALQADNGMVNFATIEAMARALSAELGLVRQEKITTIREHQARMKARKIVSMSQGDACLEGQGVERKTRELMEQSIKSRLLVSNLRLWGE